MVKTAPGEATCSSAGALQVRFGVRAGPPSMRPIFLSLRREVLRTRKGGISEGGARSKYVLFGGAEMQKKRFIFEFYK